MMLKIYKAFGRGHVMRADASIPVLVFPREPPRIPA